MKKSVSIICLLLVLTGSFAGEWLIDDDFVNLENWEPLIFPKIEEHSFYTIDNDEGLSLLRAESDGSASGLIFKDTFNVYDWPILDWRWKIDGILTGGNGTRKDGDDYAIRIYVIFEYDPEKASGFRKIQYNLAKVIYGEYPPDSGLNYVWANRDWGRDFIPNPFTDSAMMIASDTGTGHIPGWREHRVNILDDYRRVFGKEPPTRASLAIMSDSDNTGGTGRGFLDYIKVGRQ